MVGNAEQPENFNRASAELPELHEKDECNRCGNLYDSPGSCQECAARPEKKKYEDFGSDREWAWAMERAEKSQKGHPVSKEYLRTLAMAYLNQKRNNEKKNKK